MKNRIVLILALLSLVLVFCSCSRHNYTQININDYTTKDISFSTEHDTYYTDDKVITCSFTYTGTEPWVYLNESYNCFLVKESSGKLMKVEITGDPGSPWDAEYCKPGKTKLCRISLEQRYKLPLDAGTYRLAWNGFLSETFEIIERR